MSKAAKIAKYINKIANGTGNNLPIANGKNMIAKVTAITGHSCTVEYDGTTFTEVRLSAVDDTSNTNICLIEPKLGSKVMCACMDGTMNNLYIVKVQEISRVFIKTANMQFEMDTATGKYEIKSGSNSLKSILDSIVDEVKTLKVFTPTGPSGTALPPNILSLNAVKTKINQLLK